MRQNVDRMSAEYISILERQAQELSTGFDAGKRVLLDAFLRIQEITPDSDSPADKGRATRERNRILDEAKDAAKAVWGDGKPMNEARAAWDERLRTAPRRRSIAYETLLGEEVCRGRAHLHACRVALRQPLGVGAGFEISDCERDRLREIGVQALGYYLSYP